MIATTQPISYRRQKGGDYLIPRMQIRPELGASEATGFAPHVDAGAADAAYCGQMSQKPACCDGSV